MRILDTGLLIAACCAFTLCIPAKTLAQEQQTAVIETSPTPQTHQGAASATEEASSAELPNSPGTLWAQQQSAIQQQGSAPATPAQAAQSQAQTEQSTPNQSPVPQRPVGTAAAEAPTVSGFTAAQPSGVAIAPAKQRRVRTIVIKVGAIVGAGVAVGTVVALTAGTSSKPPGAR